MKCNLYKNDLIHPDCVMCHQIAVLTPVADAAKQFTKEYISFATAVDTTRHELPVKNFYIDGDRREFLGFDCLYVLICCINHVKVKFK